MQKRFNLFDTDIYEWFFVYRLNIHVTNHEEHVLMRKFDHNGDGKISMEEFYNTLAADIWTTTLDFQNKR